ncbi:MAG TPA: hypothetical protein EYM28_11980 [Rhodospirillales bacterium]|nr:hypothetical protein [Rhodospirillales bacterium]
MVQGYWSTKDLCERFRCCSRTLHRWQKRDNNPFPRPRFAHCGSSNLWAVDDVIAWEEKVAGQADAA